MDAPKPLKLTMRESKTVLAALDVAWAWEDSLMDGNKGCDKREFHKAKVRRDLYARTSERLAKRFRGTRLTDAD